MNLGELKELFEKVDDDSVLAYGLIDVFSWRGSYDEVCFVVGKNVTAAKSKLLILRALTEDFYGYKGGEYRYTKNTPVNFESSKSSYTDGEYTEQKISEILGCDVNVDRNLHLAKLMTESKY